jgi:hypothetical protein
MSGSRAIRFLPILLIVAGCCALMLQQIDLTNTDLGRHLKNGEIVVQGTRSQAASILHTNVYSVAAGDYPFLNHHWLTGVIFFLVWKISSFEGLNLFYALVVSASVVVSYLAAQRIANTMVALSLAALIITVIGLRHFIRPEGFTYLLTAVFYWVLLAWSEGWIGNRGLLWLPGVMLLWINLHIGFVFGFLLLIAFAVRLWARSRDPRRWGWLTAVSAACAVAALGNPSGIHGLLYPLHILGNYGYDISENLSLKGISDRHMWIWVYDLFLALVGLAAAVCLWRWLTQKPGSKPFWPQVLLLAILGGMALGMTRNQPLFCLLMVPLVAELVTDRLGAKWGMSGTPCWLALAGCAIGALCIGTLFEERSAAAGLTLKPGVNDAAEFLQSNRIAGPVFDDFDIGSYLIFHRFHPGGGDQVFIDGRPEAYPPGFIQDLYIRALSDEDVWHQIDGRYQFEAIVISMQDGFPPIEKFILSRVRDPEWAPVFTDFYSLIFVRRNEKNAAVIQRHLIPRSMFR